MDLSRIEEALDEPLYDQLGRVTKVVGLTIESVGPEAKLNDLCRIETDGGVYDVSIDTEFKNLIKRIRLLSI